MSHENTKREDFGRHDGVGVDLWTLTRQTCLGPVTLAMSNYGATIQRLELNDANGHPTDIVLGYDTLADYVAGGNYFGATVGRYANRIANGRCALSGQLVQLDRNEGANHLHGGRRGFDKVVWRGGPTPEGDGLIFDTTSPDGDMGFPGTLALEATYRVTDQAVLVVELVGRADAITLCNIVQHSLWNLGGHGSGHVRDHVARFAAAFYTPVDDALVPTGEVLTVENTPFDFRQPKPIGQDMDLLTAAGYDHNLVLGPAGADGLRAAAEVVCPRNGLGLRLRTDQPGVQFYAGSYLTSEHVGKGSIPYQKNAGFALETQKFPDSPNNPHFPSAQLTTSGIYRHEMQLEFFHADRDELRGSSGRQRSKISSR